MLEYLRKFSNSSAGKFTVTSVVILILVASLFVIKSTLWNSTAAAANDRIFIDADNNQTFGHSLVAGEKIPVASPSGKKNGYPAELCYWTADGKPKETPTYVMLKSYAGSSEPTFCPDCGRLVVFNNPGPSPGVKPPPTKADYQARFSRSPN